MTRTAKLETEWADGTHTFRLHYGELVELQEKCDAGPLFVLSRLQSSMWRVEDVYETIRIGLIGGGMAATKALGMAQRYVKERPDWMTNALVAQAILVAALRGIDEEPVGNGRAVAAKRKGSRKPRSRKGSGASPKSTAPASATA